MDNSGTDSSRCRRRKSLIELLESRYYKKFLPLVYTQTHAEQVLRGCPENLRIWKSSTGKTLISLPPPPKIKDVPHAKPERLGKVIKQLAECYRKDLRGKIDIANEVIKTLLNATDKVAVAFSGGRDSLVALHLTLKIKPDVPVIFVNTGIEFPESIKYIRQLKKDWNLNLYEAKADVDFWKLTEGQGIPVAGRGNTTFMRELSQKADVKLSNSCCHRMKETPARRFYSEHSIEGVVTGLRVVESLMRKLNFADYGALRYSSTYKTLISWPLYAWKDEDRDKYIQKYDLPLNPIYEMGYNRVGCWACLQDMFYKDSRVFTLQEQHPKLYKVVKEKFGQQMLNLLVAWAELEEFDFTEEDLDGLYDRCSFDMFYDAHEETKKMKKNSKN